MPEGSQSDTPQGRVLVVDDEPNALSALAELLGQEGYATATASDGFKALAVMDQFEPEVVLTDLKMPGMDGLEVLRQLRQRSQQTAVVLLTAHGTVESAVEAMKLGAVDFLQKPFAPREIRELVSRVLHRRETRQEKGHDYAYFVNGARDNLRERRFDTADELLNEVIRSVEVPRL